MKIKTLHQMQYKFIFTFKYRFFRILVFEVQFNQNYFIFNKKSVFAIFDRKYCKFSLH